MKLYSAGGAFVEVLGSISCVREREREGERERKRESDRECVGGNDIRRILCVGG